MNETINTQTTDATQEQQFNGAQMPQMPPQPPQFDATQMPTFDPSQMPQFDASQMPQLDASQMPQLDASQMPTSDGTQVPQFDATQMQAFDPSQMPQLPPPPPPMLAQGGFSHGFMAPPPDMNAWGNSEFTGEQLLNGENFMATNDISAITDANADISVNFGEQNGFGFPPPGMMPFATDGGQFTDQTASTEQQSE